MQEIYDLLDAAAKQYPIKALAPDINKAESTLRNELTQQPGYKLGLMTAILIIKRTQDLRALDVIEEFFDRVAFVLPRAQNCEVAPLAELAGRIAKEFGEHMQEVGKALADGKLDNSEARSCLKELKDVIEACVNLQAYLEREIKTKD